VIVFARGPWAHLFTGTFEQNEIPLAMAFAAGISTEPPVSGSSSSAVLQLNFVGKTIIVVFLYLSLVKSLR